MPTNLTRRQLLHRGATGGAALGAWSVLSNRLIEQALAKSPGACGSLQDIQHIVILIQEKYFAPAPPKARLRMCW